MQRDAVETVPQETERPFDRSRLWERVAYGLEDFNEVRGVWELAPPVLMIHGCREGEAEALFEIHFDYAWAEPLFCPSLRLIERVMTLTNDGIINPWFGFTLVTAEQARQTAHALLDPKGENAWLPDPRDVTSSFPPRIKEWWEEE